VPQHGAEAIEIVRREFARFDLEDHVFGPQVEVPLQGNERVVLLNPAESNNDDIAIVLPSNSDHTIQARFAVVKDGKLVETTQRVFTPNQKWWDEVADPEALVRSRRPRARSADGSLMAEIHDSRLELRADKEVRWTVPNPNMTLAQILWNRHGELVAYGAGVATIDLATGALRDRQCGFWFGRWEYPPDSFDTPLLCEVTR
jgi:hypothetical protein